jgi:hypothetical protein
MPVFIAHRGNVAGPEPEFENKIIYLKEAYSMGFGIEVDLQIYDGVLYLGHDEPQEPVDYEFLMQPYVFCHAKTVETMQVLMSAGLHCFWHEEDKLTLTSQGYMWCYPGVYPVHPKAIWLDLQGAQTPEITSNIMGVCGDDYANIKWNIK